MLTFVYHIIINLYVAQSAAVIVGCYKIEIVVGECWFSLPISITADSWVNIEYEYNIYNSGAGNSADAALWFNGQQVANLTGINYSPISSTNSIELGFLYSSFNFNFSTRTIYFDDCTVSDAYIAPSQ